MGSRRGDEGDPGDRRPVEPEEAQAHGSDPDSVPGSVERDVAVRYLLNMGYVQKGAATGLASYAISATGIERVRRMRGLPVVGQSSQGGGRSGMSGRAGRGGR